MRTDGAGTGTDIKSLISILRPMLAAAVDLFSGWAKLQQLRLSSAGAEEKPWKGRHRWWDPRLPLLVLFLPAGSKETYCQPESIVSTVGPAVWLLSTQEIHTKSCRRVSHTDEWLHSDFECTQMCVQLLSSVISNANTQSYSLLFGYLTTNLQRLRLEVANFFFFQYVNYKFSYSLLRAVPK